MCFLYVNKSQQKVSKGIIITNLETKIMHGLREALVTVVAIYNSNNLRDRTQIIIYIKHYGLRLSPDLGSASLNAV